MISFAKTLKFQHSLDKQTPNTHSRRFNGHKFATLLQRRYSRGLSITLSSDYRELRWNYPESGIETTLCLTKTNRHVKVVRATSLSLGVLREAEPARVILKTRSKAQVFKRYRRFLDDDAIDAEIFTESKTRAGRRENVCVSVKLRALLPVSRACTTH